MLKKTLTYTDFDDNERTEDFYFNLTKAEVAELNVSEPGGIVKKLEKIVLEKDQTKLIAQFKDLLLRSYGEKSPDGRRFMKTEAIREAFSQTQAYSELFMEFATNDIEAAAFVNGIIPQ